MEHNRSHVVSTRELSRHLGSAVGETTTGGLRALAAEAETTDGASTLAITVHTHPIMTTIAPTTDPRETIVDTLGAIRTGQTILVDLLMAAGGGKTLIQDAQGHVQELRRRDRPRDLGGVASLGQVLTVRVGATAPRHETRDLVHHLLVRRTRLTIVGLTRPSRACADQPTKTPLASRPSLPSAFPHDQP